MKITTLITKMLYTIEQDDKYFITDQQNFMKRITDKSYHELNIKTKTMETKGIRRILDIYENKTKTMEETIKELASDVFFEFISEIEETELYNKFIIEHEDYTENTERGSELYYRIEDKLEQKLNK